METQTDFAQEFIIDPTYMPPIQSIESTYLENGESVIIVSCMFSNDFSTQTNYNPLFDKSIDSLINEMENQLL